MTALQPLIDPKTLERCFDISASETDTTVEAIKAEANKAYKDKIYWLRVKQTEANRTARSHKLPGQYVIRGYTLVVVTNPRYAYDELPELELPEKASRSVAEIYADMDRIQDWYAEQRALGKEISKEFNDRGIAKWSELTEELAALGVEYNYVEKKDRRTA